ncbi:MAG: hypothetical protein LLG37_05225, partial [Spirochaetia bacterium]|nr:hypothetical protein [Spirochaetia bacterium]
MKRVISFINPRQGQGKTTLALYLAAALRSDTGLKPAVLELDALSYDSGAGTGEDHLVDGKRTDFFSPGFGFDILWSDDYAAAAGCGLKLSDILLIDAGSMLEKGLVELSDHVIIPTTMERADIERAKNTAAYFLKRKYPAGLFSVVI